MFYDFNAYTIGEQLLPPVLRKPKMLAYLKTLLSAVQSCRDLFFNDYVNGASYPQWSGITLYNIGDRVIWKDKAVYESVVDNNIFNPNYPQYWKKMQDNFIGLRERAKFNGQTIVLVYALNKWFNNPLPNPQIYFGGVPTYPHQFVVMVPSALYATLGSTTAESDGVIRSFINKYIVAGVQYDISTY